MQKREEEEENGPLQPVTIAYFLPDPVPMVLAKKGVIQKLQKPLDPDLSTLPIVTIAITGCKRSGKSFLLNALLYYLQNKDEGNWLKNHLASAQKPCFTENGEDSFKPGLKMWPQLIPFVDDNNAEEKVLVLLIDAELQKSCDKDVETLEKLLLSFSSIVISNSKESFQNFILESWSELDTYFQSEDAKFEMKRSNCDIKLCRNIFFVVRDFPPDQNFTWGKENKGKAYVKGKLKSCPSLHNVFKEIEETSSFFLSKLPEGSKCLDDGKFLSQLKTLTERIAEEIPKAGRRYESLNEFMKHFESASSITSRYFRITDASVKCQRQQRNVASEVETQDVHELTRGVKDIRLTDLPTIPNVENDNDDGDKYRPSFPLSNNAHEKILAVQNSTQLASHRSEIQLFINGDVYPNEVDRLRTVSYPLEDTKQNTTDGLVSSYAETKLGGIRDEAEFILQELPFRENEFISLEDKEAAEFEIYLAARGVASDEAVLLFKKIIKAELASLIQKEKRKRDENCKQIRQQISCSETTEVHLQQQHTTKDCFRPAEKTNTTISAGPKLPQLIFPIMSKKLQEMFEKQLFLSEADFINAFEQARNEEGLEPDCLSNIEPLFEDFLRNHDFLSTLFEGVARENRNRDNTLQVLQKRFAETFFANFPAWVRSVVENGEGKYQETKDFLFQTINDTFSENIGPAYIITLFKKKIEDGELYTNLDKFLKELEASLHKFTSNCKKKFDMNRSYSPEKFEEILMLPAALLDQEFIRITGIEEILHAEITAILMEYREGNVSISKNEIQLGKLLILSVVEFYHSMMKKNTEGIAFLPTKLESIHSVFTEELQKAFSNCCSYNPNQGIDLGKKLAEELSHAFILYSSRNVELIGKIRTEVNSYMQKFRDQYNKEMAIHAATEEIQLLKKNTEVTANCIKLFQMELKNIPWQDFLADPISSFKQVVEGDWNKIENQNAKLLQQKRLEEQRTREEERRKEAAERRKREEEEARIRKEREEKRKREEKEQKQREFEERQKLENERKQKKKEAEEKLKRDLEEDRKKKESEERTKEKERERRKEDEETCTLTSDSSKNQNFTASSSLQNSDPAIISALRELPTIAMEFAYSVVRTGFINNRRFELIPNMWGNECTPTTLKICENGEIRIGGPSFLSEHSTFSIGNLLQGTEHAENHPVEFYIALFLIQLKTGVETQLNGRWTKVVMTVPLSLTSAQRKTIKDSAFLAGFQNVTLINDTTAAALAFANSENYYKKSGIYVLVGVAGQKYYDAAVYECSNGTTKMISCWGNSHAYKKPSGGTRTSIVGAIKNFLWGTNHQKHEDFFNEMLGENKKDVKNCYYVEYSSNPEISSVFKTFGQNVTDYNGTSIIRGAAYTAVSSLPLCVDIFPYIFRRQKQVGELFSFKKFTGSKTELLCREFVGQNSVRNSVIKISEYSWLDSRNPVSNYQVKIDPNDCRCNGDLWAEFALSNEGIFRIPNVSLVETNQRRRSQKLRFELLSDNLNQGTLKELKDILSSQFMGKNY